MKRNVLLVLVLLIFIPILITLLIAFAVWTQEAVRTSNSESGETASEAVGDSQNDPDSEPKIAKKVKRSRTANKKPSEDDQQSVAEVRARRARRGGESNRGLVTDNHNPQKQLLSGFRLPTARKFALLVGVTDYASLSPLTCSVKDIHAIREPLIKLGFKENDIYTLESGKPARELPTKKNILERLDLVLNQVKTGDVFFFAFAGHGAENASGTYICPTYTESDNLSETAVSLSLIMEKVDASKAGFKWLVVDACRDNPFYSQTAGTTTLQHIDNPPKGIVLLQSCAENEYSYESKEAGVGLFSSSFVEALSGAADRDKNGVLTLMEVCKYTTEETNRKANETYQKTQRPYLRSETTDFILLEDLNRPKADALFANAQKLFNEENYETAKSKTAEAMKMYPKEQKYADLYETIDQILKLKQENERLAQDKAKAERNAKETAILTPKQSKPDPRPSKVGKVSATPRDDTLQPEFNPNPKQYEKLWGQKGVTDKIALSRDGKYMAVTSGDIIKKLDFKTGIVLQTLKGHKEVVHTVSYSPDGRFIASGSGGNYRWGDNTVRIWSAQTGKCLKTFEGHEDWVLSVSYSPDGKFIASGSRDWTVRIWDTQTGECVKTLEGHTSWVPSVSYSPDGQFIASAGSSDQTMRIWNVKTGKCVKTIQGHKSIVWSVSYSPDGKFIASGSDDKTVRIWNAQTGKCVKMLKGHKSDVNSVSYSPDGRFLASGSGDRYDWDPDNTVRIWNVQTGECLKTLEGDMSGVKSVSYSPDGKYLSVGAKNSLAVWRAAK